MTNTPRLIPAASHTLLLSHGRLEEASGWLLRADELFRPSGFVVCRAHSGPDTVRRVEQGGLAAAILIEDQPQIDGLSLLRIIRSIDLKLPCWLVTENTTRRTLEAALALSAMSVMTHPVDLTELIRALERLLSDPVREN